MQEEHNMKISDFVSFSKLPPEQRLNEISSYAKLTADERKILSDANSLTMEKADNMIDNVIGRYSLPMGCAVGLQVNGKEYCVPMVFEEPSVVLGVSYGAYMGSFTGGYFTSNTGSIMIAQIMLMEVPAINAAKIAIYEHIGDIKAICDAQDPTLIRFGGGMVGLDARVVSSAVGDMLVVHLKVDTKDAMGANAVNTMAEGVSPLLERLTGGVAYTRILSNLAVHRLARARVTIKKELVEGESGVDRIVATAAFAAADPFRAATHNKGIMNAISPIVLATGNDLRAVEAGAHAYAAISGQYTSLSTWEKDSNGDLCGTLELPLAVGIVGGATKIHPAAGVALKILGVESAAELAEVMVACGLAQNLSALRALAIDGIQKGHMARHAKNIAATAGASGEMLNRIVDTMIAENKINLEYAQELLEKFSVI